MAFVVAVILSALLYRFPRGTGWAIVKAPIWVGRIPKNAELPWAVGTAALVVWATGNVWAWSCIPLLILGEGPSWSKHWPSGGDQTDGRRDMFWQGVRGLLLLNPLLGVIEHVVHAVEDRLPIWPPLIDARAWMEVPSGAVTAASYLAVFSLLIR